MKQIKTYALQHLLPQQRCFLFNRFHLLYVQNSSPQMNYLGNWGSQVVSKIVYARIISSYRFCCFEYQQTKPHRYWSGRNPV